MTGQTGHEGMAWHGSDHAVGSGDTLQALLEPSMMTVLESCHLTKLNLTGSAGAMVFCEDEHVCFVVGETRKDDRIELPSVFERIFDSASLTIPLWSRLYVPNMPQTYVSNGNMSGRVTLRKKAPRIDFNDC